MRLTRGRTPVGLSALTALLTLAALLILGGNRLVLSLWRPTELYGEGLLFDTARVVLPYALIAAAATLRIDTKDEWRLLHLAAILAAIAASNLLAVVITWSVLAVWSNWRRRNIWQLAAIAPLFAAAAGGEDVLPRSTVGIFLVLAALLRSRGADQSLLECLPAFALLNRQVIGGPGLLVLGAAAIVLGTLGGRSWLAAGLIGYATLTAGLDLRLEAAAVLAGALALSVTTSGSWARWSIRNAAAGVVVASLPLWVAVLAGTSAIPLLLIPAAALLAAPLLGATGRPEPEAQALATERLRAAAPILAAAGILVANADARALAASVFALVALVLSFLMAAGPRWLYRQPAYAQLAESMLGNLGRAGAWILEAVTAALRTVNGVLEGESSTVWLLLILLIVVEGLLAG